MPIKNTAVLSAVQRHGGLFCHLGLQMLHFLCCEIRRVAHDQIQAFGGKLCLKSKHIPLPHLHRRGCNSFFKQCFFGVLPQIIECLGAFFQRCHLCIGAKPPQADAQAAAACTQIQHRRALLSLQRFSRGLTHDLGV